MKTTLSSAQTRFLRGLCHSLKPVVMIGQNGLSDNVMTEIDSAIQHHELIKVKIAQSDRAARKEMARTIIERSDSVLVQEIGQVICLYRKNDQETKIELPR